MPDFEQRKRRSLTDQQLYEEYHNTGKKPSERKRNSKGKKGSSQKKLPPAPTARKGQVPREAPPVSPERKKRQAQSESAVAAAIKSKTFAGKSGKSKKGGSSVRNKKQNGIKGRNGRRKQGKYTLYYIFIGILVAAALSILSATVLFNISVFTVEGDINYTQEQVVEACGIKKGENLLRVDIGKAEENIISKLVYIDSASIHRSFPNRLIIKAEPALPSVSFAYDGKYYVISERMRILEINEASTDCPVIKGFSFNTGEKAAEIGDIIEDDAEKRAALALNIKKLMIEYGLTEQCIIDIADTLKIKIIYDGRVEMELGSSAALDEKIRYAGMMMETEVAENEKCVISLSNPNRVVKHPIRDNAPDRDEGFIVTESTTENANEPEETTSAVTSVG